MTPALHGLAAMITLSLQLVLNVFPTFCQFAKKSHSLAQKCHDIEFSPR